MVERLLTSTSTAICAILNAFEDKPQPDLAAGLTLNALVEFMSTIARLALAVPLISGLSQLAWLAFAQHRRPLEEFALHQEATYGGYSTLKLLFGIRFPLKRSVVSCPGLRMSPCFVHADRATISTDHWFGSQPSCPSAVFLHPLLPSSL